MNERIRPTGLGLLAGLLLGGLGAGWVWFDARDDVEETRTVWSERVDEVEREQQRLQTDLAQLQATNHLLRARLAVSRAADALDARNFGTANDHLDQAREELLSVQAEAVGADPQALADLRESMQRHRVSIAEDLETQRARLQAVGARIDELLPRRPTH